MSLKNLFHKIIVYCSRVKLESSTNIPNEPRVSAEWDPGWGPQVIVEVRETEVQRDTVIVNSTNPAEGPKVVVRAEEALIVILVLILWVAAIALFFNRWGKIRMLEPYQPKFQQQHRTSCPLVDLSGTPTRTQRASLSRMSMGISLQMPTTQCSGLLPPLGNSLMYTRGQRLRQNSVFVGPQFVSPQPPRKTKSAVDIHSLVLNEGPEPV